MAGEEASKTRRGGKRKGNQRLLIAHKRRIFTERYKAHHGRGSESGEGGGRVRPQEFIETRETAESAPSSLPLKTAMRGASKNSNAFTPAAFQDCGAGFA